MPYESLKRVSRDRKYNIDDLQELVTAIKLLAERNCSELERKQSIEGLIQRATYLKNQVITSEASELTALICLKTSYASSAPGAKYSTGTCSKYVQVRD